MINEAIIIANKIYKTIIKTKDDPLFLSLGQLFTVLLSLQEFGHAIFTPP